MSATDEPKQTSDGTLHEIVSRTRLAIEFTDPQARKHQIEFLTRELLIALGENPDRAGLLETPRRVAAYWSEFIDYDPGVTDTTFESISTNHMIIVSPIRVWSLCEHHLLPFWCDISIGYIPHGKVLGLSKFARIAHQFAHKLQLQEQLVDEIATEVERVTESPDVMVIGRGEHLCMVMRGIQTPALMTSSRIMGIFASEDAARAEFLSLVR